METFLGLTASLYFALDIIAVVLLMSRPLIQWEMLVGWFRVIALFILFCDLEISNFIIDDHREN